MGWFDGPDMDPDRVWRRPMEELLVELAERTGVPIWEAGRWGDRKRPLVPPYRKRRF